MWSEAEVAARLDDTVSAWQSWSRLHQAYVGPWRDLVHHSGRVLQALSFQPTGALCRGHHLAARGRRRRPQLGLPLRMGPRSSMTSACSRRRSTRSAGSSWATSLRRSATSAWPTPPGPSPKPRPPPRSDLSDESLAAPVGLWRHGHGRRASAVLLLPRPAFLLVLHLPGIELLPGCLPVVVDDLTRGDELVVRVIEVLFRDGRHPGSTHEQVTDHGIPSTNTATPAAA